MTVLAEDDLQITLPAGFAGRKFDDEASHGLSHCMKAVDFIIELADRTFFVELKDPENPNAKSENSETFIKKFLSGAIDGELKTKFRDSWLYEYAEGRAKKPIYYLVLIAASTLSEAELLTRTDALKRQLPLQGPEGRAWKKPFMAGCVVMNIAAWNRTLAHMPVSRISS